MTPEEALDAIKKIDVCGYDPTRPGFYYSGTANEIYPEELAVLEKTLKELNTSQSKLNAKWVRVPLKKFPEEYIDVCSECNTKALAEYKYCPNCGAKMVV